MRGASHCRSSSQGLRCNECFSLGQHYEIGLFAVDQPSLLDGYAAAVHDLTARLLQHLGEKDYARVVDEGWDPPVTAAVRIYSVLEDAAKHLGQAEYVRGLLLADRSRRESSGTD